MSVEMLAQELKTTWPAIAKAAAEADAKLEQISHLLQNPGDQGPIDSEDISVVVFGSLARREWTSGSDLDWTMLIDGQADHEHANTSNRLAEMLEGKFKPPGKTRTFGNLTFSHNLIHLIGGLDDSNRNTTQRLLLLLESRAVNQTAAYERVIRGILLRYLQNDYRPFRVKVPRFLLNDLHRFWRTMCVDYASKYKEQAGEKWAIRNIKLRMSRKLIIAAGMIACYSCDPEWFALSKPGSKAAPSVEDLASYLEGFVRRTPLDILAEALVKLKKETTARSLFGLYDQFLSELDKEEVRDHLEGLPPGLEAEKDEHFRRLQAQSREFEKALEQLFFEDSPLLARLTREYGVF